jgi:hypothetical protein
MTVNLYKIDSIKDYDEAIEALEDYVEELVTEFVQSSEGKAYLKAHPEMAEYVGSWIDNFLYFGYAYESVTLPQMSKSNVKIILTGLFPRKVSLLNPEEADSTIPELIAFWQFLKREYKHPKATSIIKFLQKLEPQFKKIMNDPQHFGIAKSFFMAGTSAGFDMTTEEGLKEFQKQYNQNIQGSITNDSVTISEDFPVPQNLPEAIAFFQEELENLLETLEEESENHPQFAEEAEEVDDFQKELLSRVWQSAAQELPPLPQEAIAFFQQQEITETQPGTILQDFETLLDFIGDQGIAVSEMQNLLPMKILAELNQRLSEPVQTALKRPQQKSYPPINGLYLLLRASGLGQITNRGKKSFLILNSDLLSSWQNLNPTERYFTLLETWLIRAYEEILGERRSPFNEGMKCLQYWPQITPQGQKFPNYEEQKLLNYCPELHNIALMQLFGLLEVKSVKPEAGKGWRIKTVKKLLFGEALMQIVFRAFVERGMRWQSEDNPSLPFGELQPALQSYFSEWQNTLAIPEFEKQSGVYIFKVSLGKMWRKIAISSQMTLENLSHLILESVDFDSDHLDMFRYKNQVGRMIEVSHPYADGSPSTDEVCLGDLPLKEGFTMTYIFDFGDWWEFRVQLEQITTDNPQTDYGAIIESRGKAPVQYPDWDEMGG